MVVKNTEYRRAFKAGEVNELRQSWEGNLGYRQVRRQTEHWHHPLEWEDAEVWGDDNGSVCSTSRRPASVPLHKYKHDMFNQAYRERLQKQGQRLAQIELDGSNEATAGTSTTPTSTDLATPPTHPGHLDKVVQTSELSLEGKVKEDMKVSEKDKGVKASKTAIKKTRSTRPTKPVYRKPLPKPRPMSAPIGRSLKKHNTWSETVQSPFASYGCSDKERETGKKRTHNVRASAGVYPAALYAMRRRKLQIAKQQEELTSASHSERRRRALFNDIFKRETSAWDTEYRRNFVGYDGSEYQRRIASRIRPHTAWEALTAP